MDTILDQLGDEARQQRLAFIWHGPKSQGFLSDHEILRLRLLAWLIEEGRISEDRSD